MTATIYPRATLVAIDGTTLLYTGHALSAESLDQFVGRKITRPSIKSDCHDCIEGRPEKAAAIYVRAKRRLEKIRQQWKRQRQGAV